MPTRRPLTSRSDFQRLLSSQNVQMLDEALSRGFDINTVEDRGETLLVEAVANGEGNLEWAETLLARGADPNIPNPMGNTAVMLAVIDNKLEFLDPLVRAGANLDLLNHHQQSAFSCALELLNHQEPILTNELQRTMVVRLLELGANPNATFGIKEGTLLIELCYRGLQDELPLLALLEEKGVDINKPNVAGVAPLHLAVRDTPFDYARWLLEKGANMDAVSKDGTTVEDLCATVFKAEFDAYRNRKALAQSTPKVSRGQSHRL